MDREALPAILQQEVHHEELLFVADAKTPRERFTRKRRRRWYLAFGLATLLWVMLMLSNIELSMGGVMEQIGRDELVWRQRLWLTTLDLLDQRSHITTPGVTLWLWSIHGLVWGTAQLLLWFVLARYVIALCTYAASYTVGTRSRIVIYNKYKLSSIPRSAIIDYHTNIPRIVRKGPGSARHTSNLRDAQSSQQGHIDIILDTNRNDQMTNIPLQQQTIPINNITNLPYVANICDQRIRASKR